MKATEHSLHHTSDASGVMEIKEVDRGVVLGSAKLDHGACVLDVHKDYLRGLVEEAQQTINETKQFIQLNWILCICTICIIIFNTFFCDR